MDRPAVRLESASWKPGKGDFVFGPVAGEAAAGRFIALVGPNGAGKSTLLNLIGGVTSPDSGSVTVFGRSPGKWKPRERGRLMAFLSQDPERPFGFSVSEYVALGRFPSTGPFRAVGNGDREVVEREIRTWGLEELAHRPVTTLSGGEFQRVRLARSLCQEPGLLLMDEPGNHLDLSSRMGILERLRTDAAEGRCILAVLHDVNDALLYADEVWLMNDGRVIETGIPSEILRPERLNRIYGLELQEFRGLKELTMLGVPPRRGVQ